MRIKIFLPLLILIATSLFSQTEEPYTVKWDNALKIESADKQFQIKIGGRIQYDVMFIHQDDSLDQHFDANNGTEFRRIRLYTSGKFFNNIEYKFQLDFANGNAAPKDIYIRFTKIPGIGNFQVGNFKEPLGFEMLTSSNNKNYIGRSLTNAFTPERSLGFMVFNQWANKRISAYAGYFFNSQGKGKYLGDEYHLTGRLTALPYLKNGNSYQMIHLGLSYSHQFQGDDKLTYYSSSEAHLGPKYLTADFENVDNIDKLGTELVVVYHSFSFQSEYILNAINIKTDPTLEKSYAWYGSFSWILTGEHKEYSMGSACFGHITPRKNYGQNGGFGALELLLRYSEIALFARELQGGKMNDITFGANWYLNPVARISANYISSEVVGLGQSGIFEMRFQLVF
ncbi:MAG: hypothetical protein A2W85_14340 [Bacteroidetes bacterium GWF2_41_31]|nr:MAG: hypothetical protein A2W85_14340 [Bacteroidetes bacterium GWF2_41_31]